jgi:hypothetical protein
MRGIDNDLRLLRNVVQTGDWQGNRTPRMFSLATRRKPMKNAKKPSKKETLNTKSNAKVPATKELSEDQLEHVAGGAYDAFLKIEGVAAVTGGGVPGVVQGGGVPGATAGWDVATHKMV